MLRLLLDEHLSPDIASAIQARHSDVVIDSLLHWQQGVFLSTDDSIILTTAHRHGLTLVTYDQKTILPLLVAWGEAGTLHAGVIFGSHRTLPTADIGGIARALVRLWREQAELDWSNRIVYLTP